MKHQLKNIEEKEILPGFKGKIIHGENMTLVYWNISKGATLPVHHHIHEQAVNMIEGQFRMNIGEKDYVFGPGDVFVIPTNVPHSGEALTECRILDVFTPLREDYQ